MASTKQHNFEAIKTFKIRNFCGESINIPREYQFKGLAKSYVKDLTEMMSIKVSADGRVIKEDMYINDIPCSHVRFVD
jgi:hypothetical protein